VPDAPASNGFGEGPYEHDYGQPAGKPAHLLLLAWLSELRRRWRLAGFVAFAVLLPVTAYAVFAVPTYTAEGALQVSDSGGGMSPLLELAGGGGSGEVETEVEIIRRREFVLAVLEDLKLNLVDPQQAGFVTTDLEVAISGKSPVSSTLRRVRAAADRVMAKPELFGAIDLTLTGLDDERLEVRLGDPEDPRIYTTQIGEPLDDPAVELTFSQMPVEVGETVMLSVLGNGSLVESAIEKLRVSSMGTARQSTNLVEVRYTDADRETARAVVDRIMHRYLEQSLRWQTASASNAGEFIAQRLEEAQQQLRSEEEELRGFAEREHAVQLDAQANVTIASAAELEAQRRQIELQERVIGSVASSMKRRTLTGSADLTSNFFEDPVLAANIAALTEAETKHAVLKATLTPDHPQLKALAEQIKLRQQEVSRLLRSAQRNLSSQRKELDKRIEQAMSSLSAYPDKELQLARHMRDVEVNQRLYAFLLEKYQEAQILEASTTTDKRIVDAASLPHRKTTPARGKLLLTGTLGGLMLAFAAVYLAHLLQRRLETVEAVKEAIPWAVYGTIPTTANNGAQNGGKKKKKKGGGIDRLNPASIWADANGPAAEAFRALAVNVTLTPAAPGRGRIVQITSSQPSEGKSTVISNLGVALSKAGANVLLVDLDLRKPVQHRLWQLRRSPGYSDLIAKGGGPKRAHAVLQRNADFDVEVLAAGTKLPDTLGALMNSRLESMLVYWSERYDYVLVDSPPAFVADTTVIGRHVDLLLVAARPGVVERGNLRNTLESLARLDVPKGLVLSAVERKHAEYYYGGGYGYAQAYAAAIEEDEDQQAAS
jgi:capsular exopolysaccharide synthesis family protein